MGFWIIWVITGIKRSIPLIFKTQGEYFESIFANEIRTLKGETVKGLGELWIANHLFMLGVAYQYEAAYEHKTSGQDYRQYQPDFYLPDCGIYLEHWGIDRDGEYGAFCGRRGSITRGWHGSAELTRSMGRA